MRQVFEKASIFPISAQGHRGVNGNENAVCASTEHEGAGINSAPASKPRKGEQT
jgi:hypothetical protein